MTSLDPARGHWPSLATLRRLLLCHAVSSADLVAAALDRIAAEDPALSAVLALDPTAAAQARAADGRLRAGSRLPLDGIPVLVKDNIDTAGLATTAGSRLLAGTPPPTDAPVVAALRAAGAVLLGKTNLSEWGNFRSTSSTEGWSAVGGQTRNPHDAARSPWGSSSGSAAAIAAGMAPLALGTETDGSVVCPAAVCGVVGLKPRLGSLPNDGIVPISAVQDTPGILTASVSDARLAYTALAPGAPPSTAGHGTPLRLGLWPGRGFDAAVHRALEETGNRLREHGVDVVTVDLPMENERLLDGLRAMIAEFEPSLRRYLRRRPGAPADLAAIIAANAADDHELSVFGQDLFEVAASLGPDERRAATARRARARAWATRVLDDALHRHAVAAVVAPTAPPAWPIDHVAGDPPVPSTSTVPSLAGRPNVTVPSGLVDGLPVGVSVFGPPDTATVLSIAAVVEAATGHRCTPALSAVRVVPAG